MKKLPLGFGAWKRGATTATIVAITAIVAWLALEPSNWFAARHFGMLAENLAGA